jgi:hypothetical protein
VWLGHCKTFDFNGSQVCHTHSHEAWLLHDAADCSCASDCGLVSLLLRSLVLLHLLSIVSGGIWNAVAGRYCCCCHAHHA